MILSLALGLGIFVLTMMRLIERRLAVMVSGHHGKSKPDEMLV